MTSDPHIFVLDGRTGASRNVLGGKAWSIERMRSLDIPVPPAFVLSTAVCRAYYEAGRRLPEQTWSAVPDAVAELEKLTGREFGGAGSPLLVSVRSGAPISMPGMMDTVLNLGMTDEIERTLAEQSGDPQFAADTRQRFREQFERVVGTPAPDEPWEQLRLAAIAVLDSWNSRRAVSYRRDRGISDEDGTSVTVQAMVFGNLDDTSGTGVLFTRDPLTGSQEPYGEWLPHGQGEDVVSGRANALSLDFLAQTMPVAHADLLRAARRLEQDGRDVQDVEFTVESGTLWLLQTRAAKRSPQAVVRHAVQLGREGVISGSEVLDRIAPEHVHALLAPHLSAEHLASATVVTTGKPACPGVATARVVTDSDEAEKRADRGEDVILARPTTDPDDTAAMSLSRAVITELGGSTSHAAVVCREVGVPCVVGCGTGTLIGLDGQTVTVDAVSGTIYLGEIPIVAASEREDPDLAQVSAWAQAELDVESGDSLPDLLRARPASAGSEIGSSGGVR